MTKRLAQTAFDIISQDRAEWGKSKRARTTDMLDTIRFQSFFIRLSASIDDVIGHVERLDPQYENLINRLAAYLGQDPRELWFQNNVDTVCGFLVGIQSDLEALVRKAVDWRRQDGLGILNASLRAAFQVLPQRIVTGWLNEPGLSGYTISDTFYHAIDIVADATPSVNPGFCNFAYRIAGLSGLEPPPSIMDAPTGLTDSDNESESEEDEE